MATAYRVASAPPRWRRAAGPIGTMGLVSAPSSPGPRPGSLWGTHPAPHPRPGLVPTGPPTPTETDEEYVEMYQDRILSAQASQLYPLMEDLADWLNKTLGIDYITGTNFLDMLDNGVVVCHLARVIQDKAKQAVESGSVKGPVPAIKGRCFETAPRRSFFSRDNMENFIQFCRQLGVHENLLFESDDLVLHAQPRHVVLCLLEVARIATRYALEPPGLVQLEKEIADEEADGAHSDSGMSHSSLLSWQYQASPQNKRTKEKLRHSSSSSALSVAGCFGGGGLVPLAVRPHSSTGDRRSLGDADGGVGVTPLRGTSDGVPSDNTEDEWSRGSGEDPDLEVDLEGAQDAVTAPGVSELDRKVQLATRAVQRHCRCASAKCDKLRVKKVGEGRYSIAGKNVFIRLLKGRHMMVRVGGGWDTLEHFLQRHDPCQGSTPRHRSRSSLKKN
ncbi:growth arrest-specific protein 2-like isoform X2 [Frankliniella occidentalis]|uniref:Growth arrest-specific protein 2-like isoform X2 n=1 Tax=Frankliniella occidentalis TaxID=133901 RepID=A0A6J1SRA0_FRAOC|nr:growth arrest-specific protein 2-like isoform X2 [Frankliniella occidentalis]